MEEQRPMLRKDKYNPYTLHSKNNNCYLKIEGTDETINDIQITKELYELFDEFELEDLSYLNRVDRHIEQSEIFEDALHRRSRNKAETVKETVFNNLQNEELHNAIGKLPEIQKRRVHLYYFCGLTYKEIAEQERCKYPAVIKSIKIAIQNLKNYLTE